MTDTWPDLDWNVPAQKTSWLAERIKLLAEKTRAFELALEAASSAGEAALSAVTHELEDWEHHAANVWMYAGLGDAQQIPPDDLPLHAEELAKIYACLNGTRGEILTKLGPAAAKVTAREGAMKIDRSNIEDRIGELPNFRPDVDALGQSQAFVPVAPTSKPVTSEEVRQRQVAESKALPASGNLGALLAILPSEWVTAVFDTLGLVADEEAELTAGSRSAARRGVIHEKLLKDSGFLQQIVFALDDEDRALLADLIAAGGSQTYAAVTAKFGKDEGDGFFWNDRPAVSPLSRLRRTGLAFVGQQNKAATVVVPADLKDALARLIG